VEEAGASGVRDSEGDDFTQQGQRAAQDASHFEPLDVACEDNMLPASTRAPVVRTTSQRAAANILVIVAFICGAATSSFPPLPSSSHTWRALC
jgi:hypothetical protein